MGHIACRAKGQEELDWLTLTGDHQMQLEPKEVAAFAGNLAPILLATIDPAAANALVVARGYGKGVDDIDGITTHLFPVVAQYLDEGHDMMANSMQTA